MIILRFKNLKLRSKFLLVIALELPFLVGLTGIAIWGVTYSHQLLDIATDVQIPGHYDLAVVNEDTYAIQIDLYKSFYETRPVEIQKLAQHSAEEAANVRKYWEKYIQLPNKKEEQALFPQFEQEWQLWTTDYKELYRQLLLNTPDGRQKALELLDKTRDSNYKLVHLVEDIVNIHTAESNELTRTADDSYTFLLIIVNVVATGTLAATIALILMLSRSITQPLTQLRDATQALATGDLTQQVTFLSKDEVGELSTTYNTTLVSLRELVTQLRRQSYEVNSATEEMAAQAGNQVVGSTQQTSAIGEATNSLKQLNHTAEEIAQQALKTLETSELCLTQAQRVSSLADEMVSSQDIGRNTIAQTLTNFYNLKEQVAAVEEQQQTLTRQSTIIEGVVKLLDEIAIQTHLLALNASIEAAGAGTFGERFKVVAQEIKALSNHSLVATRDAKKALGGIVKAINTTSQSTRQILVEAEHGVEEAGSSDIVMHSLVGLSEQIKEASHLIVREVKGTTLLASSIEVTTRQQKSASQQMLEKMVEVETLASQTLDSVRHSEDATLQLRNVAYQMKLSAETFKLLSF